MKKNPKSKKAAGSSPLANHQTNKPTETLNMNNIEFPVNQNETLPKPKEIPTNQTQVTPTQKEIPTMNNTVLPASWQYTPVGNLAARNTAGFEKRPYLPDWQNNGMSLLEAIEGLGDRHTGYGLLLGEPSGGVLAVDIDGEGPLNLWLQHFQEIPNTICWTSGKPNSFQFAFQLSPEQRDKLNNYTRSRWVFKSPDGKQLDFRWTGCQSLLPPSLHPSGEHYTWVIEPNGDNLLPCPDAVIDLMLSKDTAPELSSAPPSATDQSWSAFYKESLLPRVNFSWYSRRIPQLSMRGKQEARGCCPIHGGESPDNFCVTLTNHTYCCFSGCEGEGGDPLKLLHVLDGGSGNPRGASFIEAVKTLAQELNVDIPETLKKNERTETERVRAQLKRSVSTTPDLSTAMEGWNPPVEHNCHLGYFSNPKPTQSNPNPEPEFSARTNFVIKLRHEIRSHDGMGGAYTFEVRRQYDTEPRLCTIRGSECTTSKKFLDALRGEYGSGLTSSLKDWELQHLLHRLIHEYKLAGGKEYRLAERLGRQEDGTWVFHDRQYKSDGTPTHPQESLWVYNAQLGQTKRGSEVLTDAIESPTIAPECPNALPNLIEAMRPFFGSNFQRAALTLGFVVAGLHFQQIINTEGAFPIASLYGDPGSQKTLATENALSVVGSNWSRIGSLAYTSVSALYQRGKLTGNLPFCWDDPARDKELDETINAWFNAKPRLVRNNEQKPFSPLMLTSNFAVGEFRQSTATRLFPLYFPRVVDIDMTSYDKLRRAQETASGALPSLISIGYDRAAVLDIELELAAYLPPNMLRQARSIALVCWFTEKVLQRAGAPEALTIRDWVKRFLCPSISENNQANSLADFVEKLHALQTEAKVGDWNVRVVAGRDGKDYLAVHLASVWPVIDKSFSPTYSSKIIAALVKDNGGMASSQKFVSNRDVALAYQRTIQTHTEVEAPAMTTKRCYLIPIDLAPQFSPAHLQAEEDELTSELTQLTSSLHPYVNSQNSYPVRDSGHSNSSVNRVDKKQEIERREYSESSEWGAEDMDHASEYIEHEIGVNYVNSVNSEKSESETRSQQEVQQSLPVNTPCKPSSQVDISSVNSPVNVNIGDRVQASDGLIESSEFKVDRITPEGVWVIAIPGSLAFTQRRERTGSNSPFIPTYYQKIE
jgi:hypothetical protein